MNNCNENIHNEFLKDGFINCDFCNVQLEEYKPEKYQCCDNKNIKNNACHNCGTFYGYEYVGEYVNFHENKNKIRKKINILQKVSYY